jgi:hypothetical protein
MVNEVHFNLSGLDQTFSLDVSGDLAGEAPATIDASCIAIYNVKTSDMKAIFKYESDAFDVNDTDASDIKYYVYKTAWDAAKLKVNPVHAHTLTATPMLETAGEVVANKNLVKHDFVRYLAKSLFNTPHGVDLFSNEDALLTDLVQKGASARLAIDASLVAVDISNAAFGTAGSKYSTNALTTAANFSRVLLRQVANVRPSRFYEADVSGASGIQSVPFKNGDTISFKTSIAPASLQHNLTGVSGPFTTRVYQIKLVMVADGDAPLDNIIPAETDIVGGVPATYVSGTEYPYHTA